MNLLIIDKNADKINKVLEKSHGAATIPKLTYKELSAHIWCLDCRLALLHIPRKRWKGLLVAINHRYDKRPGAYVSVVSHVVYTGRNWKLFDNYPTLVCDTKLFTAINWNDYSKYTEL